MPVEFLTDDHLRKYGRYHQNLTPEQIHDAFRLRAENYTFIQQQRKPHNQLGLALQLCHLRYLGTFLADLDETGSSVVR